MLTKKLSRANFAATLMMQRERIGKTQAETATLLDVSPRKLWEWEKAERDAPYCTQLGALEILKRVSAPVAAPKSPAQPVATLRLKKKTKPNARK